MATSILASKCNTALFSTRQCSALQKLGGKPKSAKPFEISPQYTRRNIVQHKSSPVSVFPYTMRAQQKIQTDFLNRKNYHVMGWSTGSQHDASDFHATTVLTLRRQGKLVIVSDGQVSMGDTVVKGTAKKIRRLGSDNSVLTGFAGSTADAFALFEILESRVEQRPGQLLRACVEMAKAWRTDALYRKLGAVMIVCDKDHSLLVTGNGDVQEFPDGIIAIGSGGSYALASARALMDVPGLDIEDIAKKSMKIAADICVYTNDNFTMDVLTYDAKDSKAIV